MILAYTVNESINPQLGVHKEKPEKADWIKGLCLFFKVIFKTNAGKF